MDEPDELTVEEKREKLRKSLLVASLDNTFENFDPVKGTEVALETLRELSEGSTPWQMVLLYGGVGNGKTHLCEALAIALYKRGLFSRVLTMSSIMRVLKESMHAGALGSYDALLEMYCNTDRLIIDELGGGSSGSEWEWGQLEEIIVFRYRENLAGRRLLTVLSTNLDIEEDKKNPKIPFIPMRIVSRFRDPDVGRVVLNEGEDYRGLKSEEVSDNIC